MRLKVAAKDIAGSTSMSKHLVDGDFRSKLLVGIVGQEFYQRIGEFELTCLNELNDRYGGKHFVHGANAEIGC